MDKELQGRIAWVTGPSRGIWRRIAERLAEAGCKNAISGRNGGTALDRARPVNELYSTARSRARRRSFTAIPYALWQNRGLAEMRVWLREKG